MTTTHQGADATSALPADLVGRHALTRTGRPGARPVVLVHGFGCDQTVWEHVRPALDAEHDVLAYDHVGSGRSDLQAYDDRRYGDLDGYVDDLVTLVRRLDLHDAVVVAHSVGAMMAALAAIAEPDRISGLVLVGASPCYVEDGDYHGGFVRQDLEDLLSVMDANYVGWALAMGPTVMGRPDRPDLGEDLGQRFCRLDARVGRQFARVTFLGDLREEMPYVTVPTLLLQSQDDAVAPEPVGHWLHAAIAGSELAIMNATGHCPHVSAPEETADLTLDFLRRTARPASAVPAPRAGGAPG